MNVIYSLNRENTILPDMLYADANFIYTAYADEPSSYRVQACRNFFHKAIDDDVVFVVTPKVYEELDHAIQRNICIPIARDRHIPDKDWGEVLTDSAVNALVENELSRVHGLLDRTKDIVFLKYKSDEELDVTRRVLQVHFGLQASDALHVAIANREGINSFVTLDHHFGRLDEVNLYTNNTKLLKSESSPKTPLRPIAAFKSLLHPLIEQYKAKRQVSVTGKPQKPNP